MSLQNEIRRVKQANLKFRVKRLEQRIQYLCQTICINLDCSLKAPQDLPIAEVDGQMDELKACWAELTLALSVIARLAEELA